MIQAATNAEEFLTALSQERQEAVRAIRATLLAHLPEGFEEQYWGDMLHYVVPHTRYPAGYHVNPKQPLPFISLASQKNYIALHHVGLYAHQPSLEWWVAEYPKHSSTKLDMGKGCIRFKKQVPLEAVRALAARISAEEWIDCYEKMLMARK